jgi:hypothetical protein
VKLRYQLEDIVGISVRDEPNIALSRHIPRPGANMGIKKKQDSGSQKIMGDFGVLYEGQGRNSLPF